MKYSRLLLIIFLGCLTVSWIPKTAFGEKTKALNLPKEKETYLINPAWTAKLKEKAGEAKLFVKQKAFNNNYCFLIDMSLPSGQNRFFIYNLKKDNIITAGLVAHGNCYEYWLDGRKYSNKVGSGCTSLGKYKIGSSYTGKWGYSYKLHGLDSSNNNALKRTVVLHSHSCVPDNEVADEICQSNGCPTVSPSFLQVLKPIINSSKKAGTPLDI